MKIEQVAFPLVIAAAAASLWVAFRRTAPVQVAAPAPAPNVSVPAIPPLAVPYYLPPTRWNPPARGGAQPQSFLRYPVDLTAAQAIGVAPSGNLATNDSCGCGCGM